MLAASAAVTLPAPCRLALIDEAVASSAGDSELALHGNDRAGQAGEQDRGQVDVDRGLDGGPHGRRLHKSYVRGRLPLISA